MSDFIEHLIDRHLGKGEQVLPRARARFEPDTAAAFLPQDIEEDSQPITLPTPDVNPPGNEWANHHDDWSSAKASELNKSFCGDPEPHDMEGITSPLLRAKSKELRANSTSPPLLHGNEGIKQPVHSQHQPAPVIEPAEVRTKITEPGSGPVPKPIPGVPPAPAQEALWRKEGVSKEKPAAHKYKIMNENKWEQNLENHPDNIVQTVTQRLLQPLEQNPSAGTVESRPLTPAIQNSGPDSRDFPAAAGPLSDTYQPAPLEQVQSPKLPINGRGLGVIMVEPQPLTPDTQDTGTGSPGLLEVPDWLTGKQRQLHKELFIMESKAEAEPVINVTIGRIEVRANQSPPPEQTGKKKKPSGIMSLETYLDQCR
jgi:hypothetical protein